MKRIRAWLRNWLGLGDFDRRVTKALNSQTTRINLLEGQLALLIKDLNALKNVKPVQERVTVRIEPDYERGQIDALNDFKEGND